MTYEDIAWVFQISNRRVRQIEAAALEKLRKRLDADPRLRRELEMELENVSEAKLVRRRRGATRRVIRC